MWTGGARDRTTNTIIYDMDALPPELQSTLVLLSHNFKFIITAARAHLWSIESSVTRVQNPFLPKFIQAVLQLL